MNPLIAQIDIAIVEGGERRIVRAGQPLPDAVKPDDRAELLEAGSVRAAVNETHDMPAEGAEAKPRKGKA